MELIIGEFCKTLKLRFTRNITIPMEDNNPTIFYLNSFNRIIDTR